MTFLTIAYLEKSTGTIIVLAQINYESYTLVSIGFYSALEGLYIIYILTDMRLLTNVSPSM